MDLRKRISYRWRLFLPMVLILWGVIIVMGAYQYNREKNYRIGNILEHLDLVTGRVMNAYEHDMDLISFMQFLGGYYEKGMFSNIRISVCDEEDVPIYSIGPPLSRYNILRGEEMDESDSGNNEYRDVLAALKPGKGISGMKGDHLFDLRESKDGKIAVVALMPYSLPVVEALSSGSGAWAFILLMAIVVTIIAYFSSSLVSRNVTLLRDFANRAARDTDFVADDRFPHDELGEISREIVRLYRDKVNAVKEVEREHRIAIRANEEKLMLRKQLTGNLSHELKTPIGAIKGYVDTLVENPDMDNASRTHFLNRAQLHVERLCSLLNDLSTITRLEDGRNAIILEQINFNALIFGLANEMEDASILQRLHFTYDIPEDCMVEGNKVMLYGAISNLLHNAEAYSQGHQARLECVGESDGFYAFDFWDDGIGVEKEHLPHLFERFYRVDNGRSRKKGGSGLGLPIVKSTIVAHGGNITVGNRDGGGLVFHFTLRCWRDRCSGSNNTKNSDK